MSAGERVLNFSAGPARLPLPVLEQVHKDLFNWQGCGMGVMGKVTLKETAKGHTSKHIFFAPAFLTLKWAHCAVVIVGLQR